LINLLDNAIKYTPHGGSISLEVKQDNHAVEMSVADNGPGIQKKNTIKLDSVLSPGAQSKYPWQWIGIKPGVGCSNITSR